MQLLDLQRDPSSDIFRPQSGLNDPLSLFVKGMKKRSELER